MTDVATGVPMAEESDCQTDRIYLMDRDKAVLIDADYDSDEAIDARHYLLRRTDRLLYYPPEQACLALCDYHDNLVDGMYGEHQCYLVPNHDGLCKFSSECLKTTAMKGVTSGIATIDGGTAVGGN